MDWKLDRQKREKRRTLLKSDLASTNILAEMERDFTQIFGENGNAGFFSSRGKAGDPVRRNETTQQYKSNKRD